jgi:hypothetical protein
MHRPLSLGALVLGALVVATSTGCQSERNSPEPGPSSPTPPPQVSPPPGSPEACEGSRVGPTPTRLLTSAEYNNTVRDLLGDTTHPADAFGSGGKVYGYDNNAYAAGVSQVQAEQYQSASEALAAAAVLTPGFIPCDPMVIGEEPCRDEFIDGFAKKAYRRPARADEIQILRDVFTMVRAIPGLVFEDGIEAVVETALQSPQFLDRVDEGVQGSTGDPNLVELSPYEVATRLSYFLWATMPDDDLFEAADAGKLGTREQIEAEARRMVKDPRAIEGFRNFYRQWLGFDKLENLTKDPVAFPDFTPEMGGYMKEETSRLMDHVVWELDGGVEMLLSLSYTFINGPLAKLYGYSPAPADEATWVLADFDPKRRAGLVSQGSWLAWAGHAEQTSPVLRGLFIRNKLLCQELPSPPPDANITTPAVDPNATTRERFEQHASDPYCASCHVMMDPIGLGLENYDPVGVWRDHENGFLIDDSGVIYDAGDATGDFKGPGALGAALSKSTTVRNCVVTQLFRYANGRGEDPQDECTITDLQQSFVKNNSIRELLVQMTLTEAFRRRIAVSSHLIDATKGD